MTLSILICSISNLKAQNYITRSIQYAGQTRVYSIYVPTSATALTNVPLVFNFHGGNGTRQDQISLSDMSALADTANFIALYPQALPDPNDGGSKNWLHKDPSTIDDIYFINALIDSVSADYPIDSNRIYACGYSLGGEFAYELGCRLNHKIAAIAAVARTMQTNQINNCSPAKPTGVMTIIGTNDSYNGISFGGIQYYVSANDVHNYWANNNVCDTTPIITQIPDIDASDGSTVERHSWKNSNGCIYVEHLKVLGGGHDWPGSWGNMDINSTNEIWNFVSKFDLNGRIGCTSVGGNELASYPTDIALFPNPFKDDLQIQFNDHHLGEEYKIYTDFGKVVYKGKLSSESINLSNLKSGLYIFRFQENVLKIVKE
tara:strand:+ start:748 stop:1869 length:1122 start_codon:yes stop_codon:yes gene_type:complete